MLGAFSLEIDGRAINLSTRKIASLLAYLALHPEPHAREQIATRFWGISSDEHARRSLRTALATLRQQLGNELLLSDRASVQLDPDFPLWVDAREFSQSAGSLDPSIIGIYRGDLLAGFDDEWIVSERERYRALYLETLLRLAQRFKSQGEYPNAIETARKVLATDAANEQAHQQLMWCYLALGDRHAALKQYAQCVRALAAELGVAPSPETIALYQHIQQTSILRPSVETANTNLPMPLTSFIGRERELTTIKQSLLSTRLLTLTGAGGCGKTRLAIQLAADLIADYADGVWWVELAAVSDASLVPHVVRKVLGLSEIPNVTVLDQLVTYLRAKKMLLVLDNCEHLVLACAQLADTILSQCPQVQMLATSRELLGSSGEMASLVPSLSLPAEEGGLSPETLLQWEAIRLFVERARAARADFVATPVNLSAISQVCRRLDGLPLAIELAAVRVRTLSVEQIAARLDDRFHLLTGGNRTALPRQQTLRGTIDWSHSLLFESERVVLRRLSVFAGGWTLEAAETICAGEGIATQEILDLLIHLVDKSLVLADGQAAEPRYRMLETIRQYAREKLMEAQEGERLRDRHLDYFVRLVERAEPILSTPQRSEWMPRLEAELDNLRAALEWACERDVEKARWLAGLLRLFWFFGDRLSEGHAWYGRVLGTGERLDYTRGAALALLGAGTGFRSQLPDDDARTLLEQSVAIWRALGDQARLADALLWLGNALVALGRSAEACNLYEVNETVFRQFARPSTLSQTLNLWARALATARGDNEKAKGVLEESLSISRRRGDAGALGLTYSALAAWSLQQGDYDAARRYQMEALAWHRQGGTRQQIALSLGYAADIANLQRDYAPAHVMYTEVLALSRALGNRLYEARLLSRMAYLAAQEGASAQAESLLAESLAISRERVFQLGIAECLAGYGEMRRAQGQVEQAVRLLAAPALLPFQSPTGNPFNHIAYQRSVDAARAQLAASAFDAAWAEGRALTLEQTIAEAERIPAPDKPTPATLTVAPVQHAGMSTRELEVLRLIAAGLTNPQIAERLVLSTYTVQAHLRSIYGKLGVANRSAATRYALEHHLA